MPTAAGSPTRPIPPSARFRSSAAEKIETNRCRAAGRMSLCAQDEAPPYRFVSVEGPAAIEEVEFEERLAMAHRYLGGEGGDQYMAPNADSAREDIVIRLTPEHWLTADFSRQSG